MKHACLIMIHNNFEQVKYLLGLLDSCDNDIYIHVDKKTKFTDADIDLFKSSLRKSKLFFVTRVAVNWGGYSQIKAEIALLEEAVKEYHDYYHLLSGADLPLMTWKEIDTFFSRNQGKEFVQFMKPDAIERLQERSKFYWFFQETIGNPKSAVKKKDLYKLALLGMQRAIVFTQKLFGVDRRKGEIFWCGSNWFSITNDFARYIVENKKWIEDTFRNTLCCDEVFLPTMLMKSPYKANTYRVGEQATWQEANQRMVDWRRGRPYVFRNNDFAELQQYPYCFARKFDSSIDNQIIIRWCEEVHRRELKI